jgi:hypothetical protein
VAVKILAAQVANHPVMLKRFEQEYRIANTLDHPNIVQAFAFGLSGTSAYFIMEFIEGVSLHDQVEHDGAFPEDRAVRLITQVAQALHFAHRRGVVHRDVKPDNILVRPDGRAKVIDFGLVKDLTNDLGFTREAAGLGTPHFMAPEQFSEAKRADLRCDIYSLGATLYMMLTGVLPFGSCRAMEAYKRKLDGDVPGVRQLVPALSERIEQAIRRAMSPDPRERQDSCLAFFRDVAGSKSTRALRSLGGPDGRAALPAEVKPNGRERRAWVRQCCNLGTICSTEPAGAALSAEEEHWPAVLQDVSRGGIGLLLARRFEPGTVLTIEVRLPGSRRARQLRAKVARIEARELGHWLLGCRFTEPLSDFELQGLLL